MRLSFALLASLVVASSAAAVCGFVDGTIASSPVAGDNAGLTNDVTPSCQGNNGSDISYSWIAPSSGRYIIQTDDLSDTVLVVTDAADCATELACDDDGGVGLGSLVAIDAVAGQEYVITVDSYGAAAGPFNLSIDLDLPEVCPIDADAGSALATFTGSTCGAVDDLTRGGCGPDGAEDVVFSWTAPAAGQYTFSTAGSTFDTVVSAFDSANCDILLDCQDDVEFPADPTSELVITLDAGQEIALSVEGFDGNACGDYVLTISEGCGDDDGDGICNIDDLCDGDDASGDEDFDGLCNDTDFNLTLSTDAPAPGGRLGMAVANAEPGSQVAFLLGTRIGGGPCHPTAPICTSIVNPRVVARATADASGVARGLITVPATAPSGATAYIQAAFIGASAAVTELETATVQ